ncbi:MAG: hypothetical protein E2O92_02090 [Alphaproteobacteria bacterium]|nr:MAG: hypothetical protein E2O92_02090 [Alphaproteobacteria bacterium]
MKRSTYYAMIVIAVALFVAAYLFWPRAIFLDPLGPVVVSAESVPLVPGDSGTTRVGQLKYRGGLRLTSEHNRFGGLSGLLVDPKTMEILAVSDRGLWWHSYLVHEDGKLVGVRQSTLAAVKDMSGDPLVGYGADIEGLATDNAGHVFVSLERVHQVLAFEFPGPHPLSVALNEETQAIDRFVPPNSDSLTPNAAMEALVYLDKGVLLAVTEGSFNSDNTTKGWLILGAKFNELSYLIRDMFFPVSMALLPDGNILTLERRYTPALGSAIRLCIIQRQDVKPGATLPCDQIAEIASPMTVDNFEGLRVVEGAHGETLVYILSDDNFNPMQDTLLLMFELVDNADQ